MDYIQFIKDLTKGVVDAFLFSIILLVYIGICIFVCKCIMILGTKVFGII